MLHAVWAAWKSIEWGIWPWLASVKWTVSPSVIRSVGAGTCRPKFIDWYGVGGFVAMRIVSPGPSFEVSSNGMTVELAGR